MKLIDLSHQISPDMPAYPGTQPPQILEGTTLEADGFVEKKWMMYSHTGTHIDAPAHILPHAPTLDRMPVQHFFGKAAVIDVSSVTGEIGVSLLQPHTSLFESFEFVLFHTGWSAHWGTKTYFNGFPVLSMEAALWIDSFGLKGVGVDAISVDRMDNHELTIHKILLERSILIENLTNLDILQQPGFTLSCLPLNWKDADGSPVRAVAIVN